MSMSMALTHCLNIFAILYIYSQSLSAFVIVYFMLYKNTGKPREPGFSVICFVPKEKQKKNELFINTS